MSTHVSVVISPATTTRPVVISVSQATRPVGSSARTASRTASEIWSAILSGWPSVTDSEVKEKARLLMRGRVPDLTAKAKLRRSPGHRDGAPRPAPHPGPSWTDRNRDRETRGAREGGHAATAEQHLVHALVGVTGA